MNKQSILFFLADILLIILSFFFFIWIKPASLRIYLPEYYPLFVELLISWIPISITSGKYAFKKKVSLNDFLFPVFSSTLIILGLVAVFIYFFQYFFLSRLIVFGTILLSAFFELNLFSLYYYYRKLNRQSDFLEIVEESFVSTREAETLSNTISSTKGKPEETKFPLSYYKDFIIKETNQEVYDFISENIDPARNHTLTLATTTSFNIDVLHSDYYRNIINLYEINDIKRVNRFFEAVNHKLPVGGIYINCVKTNEIKKQRIFKKLPPVLSHIYYFFYFIFRRVFPKLPFTKKLYYFMTNGFDRALSKAETFGRLYSCGFEVIAEYQTNQLLFFVARKTKPPEFDYNPTYGPLISLKRVGKNGRIIHVYKLRTMFPYDEYLQEYVYKKNALQEGGKFKDDFRISTAGRIFRKFWLDELPMIFNLLKGDLKLVGVRPLSRHYFNLYSKELQELRSKHRPGLIPPFYADMPSTLDEIMASEMNYLNAYEKHPFMTDWKYFWKAVYNIVVRRERSK